MNKTKLIYFLSAFVLIIGCFALNQSYSMFVQTETINDINSTVPTLSYSIGDNNLTIDSLIIKSNSEQLIKVKINNLGTTTIKYVLSLVEKVDGVKIQLAQLENNNIIGNLSSQNSKYIWFNITNTNMEDKEIKFSLLGTYYTLNFDNEEILLKTNIDTNDLYKLSLKDTIMLNGINANIDKSDETKSLYIEDTSITNDNNSRGIILSIEDDYTASTGELSYYFNGNVRDNYINFANMCWKVVRIEGDNSTKLILEDVDNLCQESDGNFSIPINDNVEENKEVIYNGTYGYQTNLNNQIVLEYLNPSDVEVYKEIGNVADYSMVTAFKKFQTKLTDYITYMKADNWCINNTLYEEKEQESNITYEPIIDINTNYTNWTKMYYETYVNIKNNQNTLKCNGTVLNKYSDNTDMYVSALTANEIILSGINESTGNNNYLMNSYSLSQTLEENNYTGINFWTLSPAYFDGLRSYAYSLNSNGNLTATDVLDTNTTFRPAIVLKNTNLVLSGEVTKSNPYILVTE